MTSPRFDPAAVRELLSKATPGEWTTSEGTHVGVMFRGCLFNSHAHTDNEADAALIAAAPTLLAAACDEVERLRKSEIAMAKDRMQWRAEVRRLRAERTTLDASGGNLLEETTGIIAELAAVERERDALRAEVDHLRMLLASGLRAQDQLRAEVARLRAALEEIASDGSHGGMGGGLRRDGRDLRHIARAALAPKESK